MCAKATLSSKGQLVIPKAIREELGLLLGSKLVIELREDKVLEISCTRNEITDFFGMGKNQGSENSLRNVDDIIAIAVTDNDKY